jgi:hypothetical protein
MKRGGFLKRRTPLKSKMRTLHARADNDTNRIKDEIQETVRAIVIARDGGCIFRKLLYRDFPQCGGFRKDGEPIYQADHLITRANSATFADTRLIVCLCRDHHAWKSMGGNARKAEYDAIVKKLISPARVALWERAEQDSWRPHRNFTSDWNLELAALKQELFKMHRVA